MTSPAPTRRPKGPFGRSAPYRGVFSEFIRGLSWLYLKATGWRVGSDWPVQVPKSVIVAAPHTSNWDGLTMVAVAGWYRVKLNWMGKAALVRGPLGWLVKRSGCVPVERSSSNDYVEQMRQAFASRETMHLAVAPEGTREANPNWKTGFYHIARSAGVPLLMAVLDYRTHVLRLEGPLPVTDDAAGDMAKVLSYYAEADGKFPERFVRPDW
ncbi:1-acyl-sn-glycerol-3-phosphate acyltransferase [Hyphomonas sp.]|uniref:1-acyl-sn-glycerol-3-phosphate acyltransferase n=1 Tax=Hyphomonas sp. TaxID=87 RepID=UPI0025BFBA40|nr:1-acyl-sn-glycerol-3-phosphate acyltransferase [Hyphomonas sp.]MBI1400781.1 glycerol acyltransferase [Hyphomonas sp.]